MAVIKALCLCLLVLGVSGLTDVPTLRVTRHPASTTVERGGSTNLYCAAEAEDGSALSISWKRIVAIDTLSPTLESIPTGTDGRYNVHDAMTTSFYFCVFKSLLNNFETTSNGAYVEVTYLDDFSDDDKDASIVSVTTPSLMVELACPVPASDPYPSVQWLKYDLPVSTGGNLFMRRNSLGQPSNLVIYDITADDSGVYHCEVTNDNTNNSIRESGKASVTISTAATTAGSYAPARIVSDYSYSAKQGDSVELHVGVVCKPEVTYTWEKDSVTLEGDRFTYSDLGRTLKISNVKPEDDGSYLVSFSQSGAVKGSTTIVLNVVVPITAEGDVWDYSTVLGEELTLTSDCQGSPPTYLLFETATPGALWYKDGTLLENSTSVTVHAAVSGKPTGVVTIVSAKDSDTGTYVAACFNEKAYKSFTKNVLIANKKQAITISAVERAWGLEGSSITLTCTAEGTPRPIVEWMVGIGGTPVRSGEFPRADFVVDYTYSMFKTIARLVVNNAENSDSGMFECKAFYTVRGQEYSAKESSELVVAIATSPRIRCIDVLAEEGTTATLVCAFSGVPLPDLNYRLKNGSAYEELELLGADQNNQSNLVVPNVPAEAAGVYRVDAKNVEGVRNSGLALTISPSSTRMSMNAIIGISVLVAFLLIGGLLLAILLGRWKREQNFNDEMDRLIKERKDEVSDLQMKLQLRSMENRPGMNNPLHQLPETRRQLPSFYAANIAVLAEAPMAKTLPPSLAALRKQRRAGTGIDSVIHERTVSPSSVNTIMSPADVEEVQ